MTNTLIKTALLLKTLIFLGCFTVISPATFVYSEDILPQAATVGNKNYLPEEFPKELILGMPYQQFSAGTSITAPESPQNLPFRREYTITYTDKPFKSITCYFDLDNDQPLYEFIIEYPETFDLEAYAADRYGKRVDSTSWVKETPYGFNVMIWIHENKLIVAGAIKGTEYEPTNADPIPVPKGTDKKSIQELDNLFEDLKKQTDALKE